MKRHMLAALFGALLLNGCATTAGDSRQDVRKSPKHAGASVTITNEAGKEVISGETPLSVVVEPPERHFSDRVYRVSVRQPGFEKRTLTVGVSPDGWHVPGNGALGGVFAWLVVDPASGAVYSFSPERIDPDLRQKGVARDDAGNARPTLHLTLRSELPQRVHAHLEPVDMP